MPLPVESFEITQWLGLNTWDNPVETDPRFLSDVLNVDFDQQGMIAKRRGTRKVAITFTETINFIYDFQSQQGFTWEGDRLRTLIVSGSTLYVIQNFDSLTMTISASFAATDTLHYGATSNNGVCFISNENGGVPNLLAYCTTTGGSGWVYRSAALDAPVGSSTVSATVGTNGDGAYKARYTYEDIWGNESNPNEESASVTLSSTGNGGMNVSVLASTDSTVNIINVYVLPPSTSIYYWSGSMSNTTGTFYHTVSDAVLMAGNELKYDHFTCPEGKYVYIYNDMLLVAGDPNVPDNIWPSNWQFLRQFSTDKDFARVTSGDGQPVKGFGRAYNEVVIGKADSLFLARGSDNTTFQARPHNMEYGVLGQPSMTWMWQRFCFFSDDGIYVDDSLVPTEISKIIRRSLRQLNAANLACIPPKQFSANYKYYKKLLFTAKDRLSDGENDLLFVFNYELGTWTKWSGNVPHYIASVQNADDYEYLYGGMANGSIFLFLPPNALNANSDLTSGTVSTTIASYVETPWINLAKAKGHPNWEFERIEPNYLKIYAGGEPASGNSTISLQITYKTDFSDTIRNTFSMTFNATSWPTETMQGKYVRNFGGTLGTFEWIKLKIANANRDEHFKVQKILFGFRAKPAFE